MSIPGLVFSDPPPQSNEPNLLTDWIHERSIARAELKKLIAGYAAAFLCLALVMTLMPAWLFSSTARSALATRQLAEISSQGDKEKRKDEALDALKVQSELLSSSRKAVVHSINRLLAVLNSKTDDLVIRKIRMEILQDNLEVAGEAEAAHLTAANQFIQLMEEKGAESQGVLTSARQSGVIGANGISFQFVSTGKAKP